MIGDDEEAIAGHWAYDHANYVDPQKSESLRLEMQAAAGAMAAHVRHVAATAKTEAQLSGASLALVAAAAITSLLLVVSAWLCLVAAGVWLAVETGLSVTWALLIAAAINIAAVLLLFLWSKAVLKNVGFARTLQLVIPGSR
jgi:hypothetical protein